MEERSYLENLRERNLINLYSYLPDIKRIANGDFRSTKDADIIMSCMNFIAAELIVWKDKRNEQEKDLEPFKE